MCSKFVFLMMVISSLVLVTNVRAALEPKDSSDFNEPNKFEMDVDLTTYGFWWFPFK